MGDVERLWAETAARYEARGPERDARLERFQKTRDLSEVDSPRRLEARARRLGVPVEGLEATLHRGARRGAAPAPGLGLERLIGKSDLLGVAFLDRGIAAARSVARVVVRDAAGGVAGYGTAFLVAPRLALTNNHVLASAEEAARSVLEFEYQLRADGTATAATAFALRPDHFFVSDPRLDFTLVAVEPETSRGASLAGYGFCPLIAEEGKVSNTEFVNIIQHPGGEPKQLALRENQIVDLLEDFLHYRCDTAPGSSGAPVFNDQWEVVALHHSGVPETDGQGRVLAIDGSAWRPELGEHRVRWKANEGARVSRICAHLKKLPLTPAESALLEAAYVERAQPERESGGRTDRTMDRVQVESSGDRVTVRLPVTISLRMSVGEGDLAALRDVPSPAPQPQTAPAVVSKPAPEAALAEARRQLADRGEVVSVRLGWRFRDGWLTDERVIVVAVDEKLRESTLVAQGRESLPREIGGVAIDVRTAGPLELLARRRNLEPGEALALHEAFRAPRIRYRGPANGTQLLKPVDVTRVVAHASPEAGWDTLRTFIDGTQRDLRIAMYDFGATHIRDAVAGQAGAVRLTIQPSESLSGDTKKDDQPDAEIVQSLEGALGERFAAQWMDVSRRNGWVASSYHIKVAVRDGKATWLSSGNWQSSNQPDRAVLQLDDADLLAGYNREWHVVAEGRDLAQAFKGFLDHDFANGGAPLGEPPIEERVLVGIPADWDLEFRERRREIRLFPPAVFEGPIRTQPLLTPDNYVDHVLALIESAQRTLYFQNQSLSLIDGSDPRFLALVDALLAKQRAGLDVRIIFRDIGDVRGRLEALKDHGFDMRGVRLHPKCHTKGIVVDGERVLIGSHNWTNDGTLFNRDASLIFFHAGIARYFQDLFLYDWENWSRQRTLFEGLAVELLSPEEAKQRHGLGAEAAGRHVMTLREFYGED